MKKKLIIAAFLAASFTACNNPGKSADVKTAQVKEKNMTEQQPVLKSRAYLNNNNIPSNGIALEGYCPVAYFAVDKAVKGLPEHSSDHKGVTYWFVSADAKAAFDANPEKYIPAYGGWCAFGMAVKDKFPVDPTVFKIVDGRLLLFLKNEKVNALDLWNQKNDQELSVKADEHWAKVNQ